MKFTTGAAAVAVAATGATAQDWNAWSSSSSSTTSKSAAATSTSSSSTTSKTTTTASCPATVTSYKTETTTAYEKTVETYLQTVTVPMVTSSQSVSIKPDWVNWDTSSKTTVTSVPAGCSASKTETKKTTVTSTISGTTTVTKSVYYVAASISAGGDASASWAAWKPTNTPAAASASSTGSANSAWNGIGNGNGNGNGGYNGVASAADGMPNIGGDNGNMVGPNGAVWGPDSRGNPGNGDGGLVLGTGAQVYGWVPQVPSNTASGAAPTYTARPDGTWGGTPHGGVGGWGDWNGGSGNGNGGGSSNGGSGGNGGYSNGTNGGSGNNTIPVPLPINNGTTNGSMIDGSPSSNVTTPFLPLKDSVCNTAADRSQWCGGASINTDYYEQYYTPDIDGVNAAGFSNYAGYNIPFGGKCTYNFVITNGTANHDGKEVLALLVNGQSPGPAVECNWGDLVEITVTNNMQNNGTAIHWHGIRQLGSNDQDGVPGVTECALAPGQSRTYTWYASSYGTSWYHSHWGLQYGDGLQGPIIIHGPATANYDIDAGPVMLSDTYNMTAAQFNSIIGHQGPENTLNYLMNGHNVAWDLSAGQHSLWKVQKGKKYLFRLINSAAQNMYTVSIDQHTMTVIAADFVPIVPYTTDSVNIGIGQRYDVIVEMNQDVASYFFRAVTQTACPSGCANSGMSQGNGIIAYEGVAENPILLPTSTINGNKTAVDFAICADEPLASLVPWLKKSGGSLSSFTSSAETLEAGNVAALQTTDDGLVFRWTINGGSMYVNYTQPTLQSLSQGYNVSNSSVYANNIVLTQQNVWVYFVIHNQFGAYHPMHLHGHDFSILAQGNGPWDPSQASAMNFDNPMRRDTAMLHGDPNPFQPGVAPVGGHTVIGFETNNPGAWLMHCHIAWHVDGGLALQWIERPDDMKPSGFTTSDEFADECQSYDTYQSNNVYTRPFSSQSGLKKRNTYFDRLVGDMKSVVRRDNHAAKHFLEGHQRRNIGDGNNRRSFARRHNL